MTVIRRKLKTCEYPLSNTPSDVESLGLHSTSTSDVESNIGDSVVTLPSVAPLPSVVTKATTINFSDECVCRKGYVGRRKQRRATNNRIMLQTLIENEEMSSTEFVQLTDPYQTPFERLMEDESALKFWNDFTELPEEEQTLIIDPKKESRIPSVSQVDNSVGRISSKVKRAMKIKKNIPFEIITDMEKNVLDHFQTSPSLVYTTSPKNSFERLMLHAIAQFHSLQSIGLVGTWPPCIQVSTQDNKWRPKVVLFCETVKQLHK